MKVYPLLLYVLSSLVFIASCTNDDGFEILNLLTNDFCKDGLPTTGCADLPELSELEIEDFRDLIIGDWEIVAVGFVDANTGEEICNNNPESPTAFTFTADGQYHVEMPDGQRANSAYEITTICGSAPICLYRITYEASDLPYRPRFEKICPISKIAWYDYRPVDGPLEIFKKR